MNEQPDPKKEGEGTPEAAAAKQGPDATAAADAAKAEAPAKAGDAEAPADAAKAEAKAEAPAGDSSDKEAPKAAKPAAPAKADGPKRPAAAAEKAAAPKRPAAAAKAGAGDGDVPKGTYPKARKDDPDRQKRIEEAKKIAAAKAAGAKGAAAGAAKAAPKKKKAAVPISKAEKPVEPATSTQSYTRRDFLRLGIWGGALLFLGQISLFFLDFFWPRRLGAFGSRINIGPVEKFPLGTVTAVDAGKFYLVHVNDGLLAVYWTCTHLGCTVPWQPDKHPEHGGCFCCGCHGSEFAVTGDYLGGPAPRPLDLFPVEVVDGEIWVDTGTIIERERYHPSQATPV